MDYTLTEEQEQLRRLVEEFVAREAKPYWEQHGHEDFPWPLFRLLILHHRARRTLSAGQSSRQCAFGSWASTTDHQPVWHERAEEPVPSANGARGLAGSVCAYRTARRLGRFEH